MNRFQTLGVVLATFISLLAADEARSAPLKVMSFNTMCDICKDHRDYGKWRHRIKALADTIRRHDPDLVSVQEFRNRRQMSRVNQMLGNRYRLIFGRALFNFTDSALMVRKTRFDVLAIDGGFLGPNYPRFSLGWTIRIPRRLQIVTLRDNQDGSKFHFAGSHFDNAGKNKEPSAKLVVELFSNSEIPVIFAGDTNSKPTSPGYAALKSFFRDTFTEVSSPSFVANGPYDIREGCHYYWRDTFPACRIDHVLLSPNSPWQAKSFSIDVYRYGKKRTLASDHRAVVVELETTSNSK